MTKVSYLLIVFLIFLALGSSPIHAQEETTSLSGPEANSPVPHGTAVTATIGEYTFILFGYTSPHALVTLDGVGTFDQTYANGKGYFAFKNRFSPFTNREACLSAKDQFGRVSRHTCLPPFPISRNVNIGPVLLAPTISFDKRSYFTGDQVILTGQTIPNTNVKLSFFIDEKASLFSLVKSAYAVAFPTLEAKADAKGSYSIIAPSSYTDTFRVFAQTGFEDQSSPQSVELSIKILPWWMVAVQFLRFLLNAIASRWIEILIVLQVLILISYFLRRYLHPYAIHKARAIIVHDKYPLFLPDHSLFLPDHDIKAMKDNVRQ